MPFTKGNNANPMGRPKKQKPIITSFKAALTLSRLKANPIDELVKLARETGTDAKTRKEIWQFCQQYVEKSADKRDLTPEGSLAQAEATQAMIRELEGGIVGVTPPAIDGSAAPCEGGEAAGSDETPPV